MTEMVADMNVVRQKVEDVKELVFRLSYEIDQLRKDTEEAAGKSRDAYRLVIQDKIWKIETALVCLSHGVIDHTLMDAAQPRIGEFGC